MTKTIYAGLLAAMLALNFGSLAQALVAPAPIDLLFSKVLAGASCQQIMNNGIRCEYKVGQKLKFSIKDAGGSDPVIAFHHSDSEDDFYAVMYFGCIVVVPGDASKEKYDGGGIYIAPKNGLAFRTLNECQSANK